MTISVELADFAPRRLVCLAADLDKRYAGIRETTFLIFGSVEAAQYYSGDDAGFEEPIILGSGDRTKPPTAVPDLSALPKQLHAVYYRNNRRSERSIRLKPLGYRADMPNDTVIDLTRKKLPECRLSVANRCVLQAEEPEYPSAAYDKRQSGSVMLTGVITSDGRIPLVSVAQVNVPQGAGELVEASKRNLMSWRFEAKAAEIGFRITYRYAIGPVFPKGIRVEFRLPDEVLVQANPGS
jgi:hypothetical protein